MTHYNEVLYYHINTQKNISCTSIQKRKPYSSIYKFFFDEIIYYLFSSLMRHVVANLISYLKNKEYLYQELTGEHEIPLEK